MKTLSYLLLPLFLAVVFCAGCTDHTVSVSAPAERTCTVVNYFSHDTTDCTFAFIGHTIIIDYNGDNLLINPVFDSAYSIGLTAV